MEKCCIFIAKEVSQFERFIPSFMELFNTKNLNINICRDRYRKNWSRCRIYIGALIPKYF